MKIKRTDLYTIPQNKAIDNNLPVSGINLYSSTITQLTRFIALFQIGNIRGKTVLDIGCGTGELSNFIKPNLYTGWDINSKVIEFAKNNKPKYRFEVVDIENINIKRISEKWDFVFASGLFTYKDKKHPKYYLKIIRKMFSLSRIGAGFNMLSYYRDTQFKKSSEELYCKPEIIFSEMKNLTKYVNLLHSYHPGDFTIHLFKSINKLSL